MFLEREVIRRPLRKDNNFVMRCTTFQDGRNLSIQRVFVKHDQRPLVSRFGVCGGPRLALNRHFGLIGDVPVLSRETVSNSKSECFPELIHARSAI
jgi:hypothetical protein